MNILCALYKIFLNCINTVMRLGYHDYVNQIWNKSENTYRNYKIFSIYKYIIHRDDKDI